jgi:hypothetical protein
MKTMRDANAAGEEEVQKELIKLALEASASNSCASTPVCNPDSRNEYELENLKVVQPLFLGPPLDKAMMRTTTSESSTDSVEKEKTRPISTETSSSMGTLCQSPSQTQFHNDKQVTGKKYVTYDGPTWY